MVEVRTKSIINEFLRIPLQTANEKAGKHSGCMMWPGSGFAYENTSCTFTHAFDMNVTMTERVDIAIDWFKHEQTPANLVMLYIEQPDFLGHVYSPDSTQVRARCCSSSKMIIFLLLTIERHLNKQFAIF